MAAFAWSSPNEGTLVAEVDGHDAIPESSESNNRKNTVVGR